MGNDIQLDSPALRAARRNKYQSKMKLKMLAIST